MAGCHAYSPIVQTLLLGFPDIGGDRGESSPQKRGQVADVAISSVISRGDYPLASQTSAEDSRLEVEMRGLILPVQVTKNQLM